MIIIRKLFSSIKDAKVFEDFIELNLGSNTEASDWDNIYDTLNNKMKESIINIVLDKDKLRKYILNYENPHDISSLKEYKISQSELGKYLNVFEISLEDKNNKGVEFNICVGVDKPGTKFLGFWVIHFLVSSNGSFEMLDISYND